MRRLRRLKRSSWAKISVAAAAVVVAVVLITGISYASNNQPFLGDCIEFGIVCNYLNQTGDVESNFAAGKYQGNGHYIGNTISKDKANAAGVIKVGEVVGELKTRENPIIIKGKEVKEEVKAMLASVKNYAESVVKKSNMEAPAKVADQNNHLLDISGIDSDLVYVAADNLAKQIKNYEVQNGGLKIKLRANQTIVLNITEKNDVTIPRYNVEVVNGKKSNEEIAETVIWNMPYVNNLAINSDGMHSTIIAPNAFVNLNVTGEGWLVCDTIVSTGGEWHMISRKVPNGTPTPKVTATPTPKATPTPTATATPTPKATPTPTPTPTDELTPPPTATPTPEPTATPTPEPTATPTPEPTATPTPEPTATPTPEPTATPTPEPTATPTPEPTATPTPEPTATPTPEPKGDLIITKTIEGDIDRIAAENEISFEVTNEVTGEKITLKLEDFEYSESTHKYTYTLKDVSAGDYTVVEVVKDVEGYVLASVEYTIDGKEAIQGKTADVTVVDDKKTTVDYENTYEPEKGNLILTKTLEGPIELIKPGETISFEITNDSTGETFVKYLSDFTYSEEDDMYVLFIRDVVGTYTIKESVIDVDGVVLASVEYTVDSQEAKEGSEASITIKKDGTTVTSYKNYYDTIVTPTPVVTPTEEVTPTPEVTATPAEEVTPTPEVTATPTPEVTATPTPEVTATPTPKATATPTPKPTATPTPEPTATPTPKPTATPTPEPTATPTPEPTATPTSEPTATPPEEVTETPGPTATPTEEETPAPEETPTGEVTATPTATPAETVETSTPTETPLSVIEEDTPLATKKLTDPKVPTTSKAKKKSNTTMLLDEDVPLSDSAPETGDTTNLLFPMLAMGISLLAIVAVLFLRKKRN